MKGRQLKTPAIDSKERVYCGAFALMTITGKNHEQACRTIRRANGFDKGKTVRGLWNHQLIKAFKHCGLKIKTVFDYKYPRQERPTLRQWIESRRGKDIHRCYVVNVCRHYVVINGYYLSDTFTKKPVRYEDAPHMQKRVERVFQIGG